MSLDDRAREVARRLSRRVDRLPALLVVIAAVALLARLLLLGDRIVHWDEGRVGYDLLRYVATGGWEYRPIVHGPFLPHVNKVVVRALGANDFTVRLVPALVGGLLPLSAWLYREHLRDVETLALALLLTVDPVLLYYSRFMRNDVLVAAFAFTALGFYVRLHDTGRTRYLYAGTLLLALAFTAKENAILYPVTVLGGLALLLDHRLFLARGGDPDWSTVLGRRLRGAGERLWAFRFALLLAAVEFAAIFVFFYAPREATAGGIGLWNALANPAQLPDVVAAATYNPEPCGGGASDYCEGAIERAYSSWFSGGHQDHAYLPYLGHSLRVLAIASGGLALLAVVGFLADRYHGERPRDLVALGFYWGLLSLLGYPIAVDIRAAWTVVNTIVPLSIPAAVAIGIFVDWGREGLERDDRVSVGLAALVVVLLVGQLAVVSVQTSYVSHQRQGNVLVQYAQPEGEMRPALDAMEAAARENEGVDVVWYGSHFYVDNESSDYRLPASGNWYNRLPMPWYTERFGATVTSREDADDLRALVEAERPPVVLVRQQDVSADDEFRDVMSGAGYRTYAYEFRQHSEEIVFYVDEAYVESETT